MSGILQKRIRVLAREIYCGISDNLFKYLLFALYTAMLTWGKYWKFHGVLPSYGFFGNILNGTLCGLPAKNIFREFDLDIPAGWLLIAIFAIYTTGDYIYDDLKNMGVVKIAVAGRRSWWNNKCIWALFSAFLYNMIFFGVQWLTLFALNKKNIVPALDAGIFKNGFDAFMGHNNELIIYTIVVPVMCFSVLLFGNIVISMIFNPSLALVVLAVYIVAGVFVSSPIFISNQLMLVRCDMVYEFGWNAETAIISDLIVIITLYFIGKSYVKYRDYI